MELLPGDITSFLEENYEPSGDALVWRRKDLALDGASRHGRLDVAEAPTDVLVDAAGRRRSSRRGGRCAARRAVAPRSAFLYRPADLVITIHARPEGATVSSGRLGLIVNDRTLGDLALAAGWHDYAFRVPAAAWRRGLNRVRLLHTAGGDESGAGDDAGARPVALAVDYLQLTPTRPSP